VRAAETYRANGAPRKTIHGVYWQDLPVQMLKGWQRELAKSQLRSVQRKLAGRYVWP